MKKNIFYDLGIQRSKRNNYKNDKYILHNNILVKYSNQGITVYSETDKEGFLYINKELDKDSDYEFSFKWVNGRFITPIIQIREVSNINSFITFQKQNTNDWQIYNNINEKNHLIDFKGTKTFMKQEIKKNDKIKLIKEKNNIKVYCEEKLVIEYNVYFNSNFFIGFGGHSYGDRCTTFKEVMIRQLNYY